MSGYSGGNQSWGGGAGGGKAGIAPRKPMGIQFVKSSDTSNPLSQSSTDRSSSSSGGGGIGTGGFGGNRSPSTNSSGGLLPIPKQNFNFNNTRNNQPLIRFGSPAVSFGSSSDKSRPSPASFSSTSKFPNQSFVKSGDSYSSLKSANGPRMGGGYRMPGVSNLNRELPSGSVATYQRTPEARPLCSTEEYLKAWKEETDPMLQKIRKLAYEVVMLKSDRPNAKDKLHSASNKVPMRIEFNMQPMNGPKNSKAFLCYVYMENINIASGRGAKMKDSKTNGYEAALQKILMPHLRIVPTDPTSKELQGSAEPFTSPPPEPSKVPLSNSASDTGSQLKETNMDACGLKRRFNEYKQLDDFVVVEPKIPIPDCTPTHTLRRSADFNHMLLEYEYFFKGESARCVLKIENEVLADVNGMSKAAAKNIASAQALLKLKKFCWIIKTKQAVDSNTKISKEEMLNELNEQSDAITNDNIGNKMLRKMGWSGGGVGKDGDGIAEPVSLKSVLNREGLGLSSSKGVTDEFRRRIKEVIETYAASANQEDLVFSCDFRLEERQIVHDECRRLNLRSKSKGKGQKRYLCVRRKRSVNQLFDHLMSVGGETARYQLVPPGSDRSPVLAPTDQSTTNAFYSSTSKSSVMVSPSKPMVGNPQPPSLLGLPGNNSWQQQQQQQQNHFMQHQSTSGTGASHMVAGGHQKTSPFSGTQPLMDGARGGRMGGGNYHSGSNSTTSNSGGGPTKSSVGQNLRNNNWNSGGLLHAPKNSIPPGDGDYGNSGQTNKTMTAAGGGGWQGQGQVGGMGSYGGSCGTTTNNTMASYQNMGAGGGGNGGMANVSFGNSSPSRPTNAKGGGGGGGSWLQQQQPPQQQNFIGIGGGYNNGTGYQGNMGGGVGFGGGGGYSTYDSNGGDYSNVSVASQQAMMIAASTNSSSGNGSSSSTHAMRMGGVGDMQFQQQASLPSSSSSSSPQMNSYNCNSTQSSNSSVSPHSQSQQTMSRGGGVMGNQNDQQGWTPVGGQQQWVGGQQPAAANANGVAGNMMMGGGYGYNNTYSNSVNGGVGGSNLYVNGGAGGGHSMQPMQQQQLYNNSPNQNQSQSRSFGGGGYSNR